MKSSPIRRKKMFKSLKRIVYKVNDLEKAKQWYNDFLNTEPIFSAPFVAIYKIGDCSLSLSLSQSTPSSNNNEQSETYWEVDDIDATYSRLLDLGAKSLAPVKTVINIRVAKVIDPFNNVIGITGNVLDVKSRAVEFQPSETAMTTAFCRALAFKEERKEIQGPDNLAEIFLTDEAKKPLKDSATRKWAIQNLVTSPLYGYLLARTAYFDQIFKKHISENIDQIVFLGAGYDTRAYRYNDLIKNTRIFELDIYSTQERKLATLRKSNIAIPLQIVHVNIDFKNEKIEQALSKYEYSETAKTLFIWEGVTYYLPENAIINTLSFIKSHSPKGSILCFDYATEKLDSFNTAEPFKSWIGNGKEGVESFVSPFGFRTIQHLDSKEMEREFLTLNDGSVAENVLSKFCFYYGALSKE
jgi:methyltransferase (TIGR00027 family)